MIELKNISKSFQSKAGLVRGLKNVSLTVQQGEIFGVIGKSGAGKSTLIRCVNLLERPDVGQVLVDRQSLMPLSNKQLRQVRHHIGMVFQHFNLLRSRTVFQNVALPLTLIKKSKHEILHKVMPLLDLVGLKDRANAYPAQLSGGQKQRVAIARALATQPKLLLCDEMTSALDPETTHAILELVQKINAEMHLTILLITHDMEVIKRICDRVAVLDQGAVIEQGEVVTVFRKPTHPITKGLLQSAFHLRLPRALENKITLEHVPESYALWRISFVGESVGQPLMNDLIRRFNLTISILHSNLEILHTKPIGMMLVAVTGAGEVYDKAVTYLTQIGLTVEVIGYVRRNDWHFE